MCIKEKRCGIAHLQYREHGLTDVERVSPVMIGDRAVVLTNSQ